MPCSLIAARPSGAATTVSAPFRTTTAPDMSRRPAGALDLRGRLEIRVGPSNSRANSPVMRGEHDRRCPAAMWPASAASEALEARQGVGVEDEAAPADGATAIVAGHRRRMPRRRPDHAPALKRSSTRRIAEVVRAVAAAAA